MTHDEWIKDAQAGLDDAAEKIAQQSMGGDLLGNLGQWWDGLGPDTQRIVKNSLIGGALGAGTLGTAGAMTAGEDESSIGQAIKNGLIGTVGGAIAGGAGTAGWDMLTKGRQLPGETQPGGATGSVIDGLANETTRGVLSAPFTVAGGLGAGGAALAKLPGAEAAYEAMLKNDAYTPGDKKNIMAAVEDVLAKKRQGGVRDALSAKLPGAKLRALQTAGSSAAGIMEHLDPKAIAANIKPKRLSIGKSPLTRGKAALIGLPLGALVGSLGDRYLRGDYE